MPQDEAAAKVSEKAAHDLAEHVEKYEKSYGEYAKKYIANLCQFVKAYGGDLPDGKCGDSSEQKQLPGTL